MNKKTSLVLLIALVFGISSNPIASTIDIGHTPLFLNTTVDPNVFFEVDDSGSMDWEVLTRQHWHYCAYDPDALGSGALSSGDCGWWVDNGLWRVYTGSSFRYFEYIFDNGDNSYSNGCNGGREAVYSCDPDMSTNFPYELDWRVLSSSLNVVYYNPAVTYGPWDGPCRTGDLDCLDGSFIDARSNPKEGETGNALSRDLTGFTYEVWIDDKGFDEADGRPMRGANTNITSTPNGLVDLWDSHVQYTVGATSITVRRVTYAPDATGLNPSVTTTVLSGTDVDDWGRSISEIKENIANWYQYSRKRSYVTKGAISAVVRENPGFRFGLSVINNSSSLFVEVPGAGVTDYTSHNTGLLSDLYAYNWPAAGTPLRNGLKTAGDYFDGTLAGRADPIIHECQKCFTVLFTDGYWNGWVSSVGDEDGDGISDTLADVAKEYYDRDLSPLDNEVPADDFDTATHQHMVTYTVAFGVNGNLVDTDSDGWPDPVLAENGNWGNPFSCWDCPEKIDDMWHAAFNSKGTFVSAQTPEEVVSSLREALSNIASRVASISSVTLNAGSVSNLSTIYQARFSNDHWQGFLEAREVTAGVVGPLRWEAGTLIPSYGSRKILTYDGSQGVPFRWSSISSSQQVLLDKNIMGTPDGRGSDRLDYLRGDTSNEESNSGSFRNRPNSVLGDIVNSSPQFVANEDFRFRDTLEASSYHDFVAGLKSSREAMVYVGSNDGMLHGFNAVTGVEEIAYVPSPVFERLSALTSPNYDHYYYVDGTPTIADAHLSSGWRTILLGGLNAGGQGIYALDVTDPSLFRESYASQVVMWEFTDADDEDLGYTFSQPNIVRMATGDWAAVFGNGFNNTESDGRASSTGNAVLYIVNLETGNIIKKIDTKIGQSDDPKGASRPNGLATVAPVDLDGDGVIDSIYGGDLFGNMWKFDVSSSNTSHWKSAYGAGANPKPLFTACNGTSCGSSNAQAITTARPEVGLCPGKGVMVYFGTGQYLGLSDVTDTSVQSFYGILDAGAQVTSRSFLLEQTIQHEGGLSLTDGTTPDFETRVTSDHVLSTEKGWYMDFVSPVSGSIGERMVFKPLLRSGRIIFTTLIPEVNACTGGGDSWIMELDACTGGRLDEAPFDLDDDGYFNNDDYVNTGTLTSPDFHNASGRRFSEIVATPGVSVDVDKEIKYLSGSSGGITEVNESLGRSLPKRQSWREIK